MTKPVIVAVDDDPQVLAAVARDLRRRYGAGYRIVRSASGEEALEAVRELKGRGEEVATLVADQRMPGMTGTEFLRSVREIFPEARKVLLTAYADTDAAIAAINEVGLDHYLMKPWDPPEDHLYPVLDELLDDWRANMPAPFDGIRVIAARWSPSAHVVKDFLARNQVPYRFLDVEKDSEARRLMEAATNGTGDMPVVLFPEGEPLVRPALKELAARTGFQTEAKNPFYDMVIVGGGPAGLGAGVYGGSEGLRTLIIEREATGGQAGTSSRIENYLGFPNGIAGADLARRAAAQAQKFGTEILSATEVSTVTVEEPVKSVVLGDGTTISCHALVISTGMTVRRLGVSAAERLVGSGVYYGAAPSEAAGYKGEHVFVVGGANSAGQAAMMLSRFAGQVTMIVRGDTLEAKMSQYLVDQIRETPNIEILLTAEVADVSGSSHLEGLVVRNRKTGVETHREAAGLFIFIGAIPHSDFVQGVLEMDSRGFIRTGPDLRIDGRWPASWNLDRDPFVMEASVPGIFAAGDVRAGVVRRVASAVGQGAICVALVHKYLETV